ncbi:MAG: TolC family protein [Phycisphaerae bacterium]
MLTHSIPVTAGSGKTLVLRHTLVGLLVGLHPFPLRAGGPAPSAVPAPSAASVAAYDPTGQQPREGGLVPTGSWHISPERFLHHIPDPELDRGQCLAELESARRSDDVAGVNYHERILERLDGFRRPRQVRLSLEDAIRRALENNYELQVESYNPAIETTLVVEALSAFDAVFFGDLNVRKLDAPTDNQLFSTGGQFLTMNLGVRKRTALGAVVTGTYRLDRTKQDFAFQTLNPAYTSRIILDVRQPLLRGFGIDVNRSEILIRKNNRRISDLGFRQFATAGRSVVDVLVAVEAAYWRLVQARRDVSITARELADFEGMYDYLVARRDFDITPVQIESTKADLEIARAGFIRVRNELREAEDELIAASMNDPEINLADDIEIIPTDFPSLERIRVNRLAEMQTALDNRPEIKQEELRVANAKIGVGVAKNNELPQLDLVFNMTHQGLSSNADRSFDEVSRRNFITYVVFVQLEVPIGNRGPRAARRRAELQHLQAEAALRRTLEGVLREVSVAVRRMESSYDQIGPSFESAEAFERQVNSIVARAERKDLNTLQTELNARRSLAAARRTMVINMVNYSNAITTLERAKGTLLQYNNVVVPSELGPDGDLPPGHRN